MPATMDLLVITHTGHVVAGVSRASGGPSLEAADLAGERVPIRSIRRQANSDMPFTAWLHHGLLEIKSAPFDARVLAAPQEYVIDGGGAVMLGADGPASPVQALDQDRIVLRGADGYPEQEVVAVVAAMDDQTGVVRTQLGAYPPVGGTDALLPLTIMPGEVPTSLTGGLVCGVMIAMAGRRLHWAIETV